MIRCLQTREIVAPDVPFRIEPALREIDFGYWEGKTLEWLAARDPGAIAERRRDPVRFRPPGGESFEDVAARLPAVVESLHQTNGALVVSHRGTLAVLERLLRELPLDSQAIKSLEPAEFHVIELSG